MWELPFVSSHKVGIPEFDVQPVIGPGFMFFPTSCALQVARAHSICTTKDLQCE